MKIQEAAKIFQSLSNPNALAFMLNLYKKENISVYFDRKEAFLTKNNITEEDLKDLEATGILYQKENDDFITLYADCARIDQVMYLFKDELFHLDDKGYLIS